jgi:beta-phosphoglucomutase-like phosphatase (HAD superfamily)
MATGRGTLSCCCTTQTPQHDTTRHHDTKHPTRAEDFLQQREEILDRLFPDAPLLPGVERLLRHLHAHGVPLAVRRLSLTSYS